MDSTRTEPAAPRASALAEFLRRSSDPNTSDWLRLARELPSARSLDREALARFVPRLLEAIARVAEAGDRGERELSELAAAHAEERLASGFELEEIVQEHSMLRACVLAQAQSARLGAADLASVSRAIDAAVIAAVRHHATARDRGVDRSRERHRFLASASRRLSESLELDETLASLAQLCIERLSDWCAIDLVLEDGSLRRVVVEHRDPEKRALAGELYSRYPAERGIRAGGALQVVQTARPVLVTRVTDELLRRVARDEEHLRILRGLGLRSYICVPMSARGRVLGAITLCSDDPRRLHDELDLEVAEELAQGAALAVENARLYRESRESIQQRDELLAVVSHDLRNPLNVVHMGATLLAENGAGALGSVRDQAERILRAAHRMERLSQDLLDVASIERGQLAVVRKPEPPEPIFEEITESFRAPMQARGIDLRVSSTLRAALDVDRDRVIQVLANLLSNAQRFTPSGGSVTVSAEEEGQYACFSVADTGSGIPADEQPHLFRRHWRGRDAGYRGTGRGLAIAKGIVEAHGGRIWLESAVGQGTTFYFTLPLAPS